MSSYAIDVGVVAVFLVLVAIPWSTLVDSRIDLSNIMGGISAAHPLGTDNLGRDLLLRIIEAVRGGVLPLWIGVATGSALGALAAIWLASLGGPAWATFKLTCRTSAAIVAAIPVGIVAFGWAALQQQAGLIPVLVSLSTLFAVRTYLQVSDMYARDQLLAYWQAHAAMGGHVLGRLWRYGLRGNWKWSLLDSLSFHLRAAVAIEASLSYLGFGIQEPQASFGNMLASHFDSYLKGHWAVLVIIVAALALTAAFPASFAALAASLRRRM